MTYITFIKLVLVNNVSAAIHTDPHFGTTKNVLLEATYPWICEIQQIGPSNTFFWIFVSVLRLAL